MELCSCYFCGVAGRTVQSRLLSGVEVTLCPRCEEKLARLRAATDGDFDATGATPVTFDAPAAGPGEPDASAAAPSEASDSTAEAEPSPGDGVARPDTESGPGDGDDPSENTGTDDAANGGSGDDGPSGLRGLGAADQGSRSTYRKALRLLRNRDFPMARSDTVDLLSSAYDLDREECDRLLDLCVDRGLLAEENGELREP